MSQHHHWCAGSWMWVTSISAWKGKLSSHMKMSDSLETMYSVSPNLKNILKTLFFTYKKLELHILCHGQYLCFQNASYILTYRVVCLFLMIITPKTLLNEVNIWLQTHWICWGINFLPIMSFMNCPVITVMHGTNFGGSWKGKMHTPIIIAV